jgi:hypothetical protein
VRRWPHRSPLTSCTRKSQHGWQLTGRWWSRASLAANLKQQKYQSVSHCRPHWASFASRWSWPPLRLDDALTHAPAGWQSALTELDAAAMDVGIELRVFGSLAWQALSGLQYVTPQSDIDLLWHPQSHVKLQQGIVLLKRWEQDSGLRADGEMLFGGSNAVSWREWATLKPAGDQRVLVKRISSAELVDVGELLEMLA